MRRKGQDFVHTPMGHVCQGKPLAASHPFFSRLGNGSTLETGATNVRNGQGREGVIENFAYDDEEEYDDGEDYYGGGEDKDGVSDESGLCEEEESIADDKGVLSDGVGY